MPISVRKSVFPAPMSARCGRVRNLSPRIALLYRSLAQTNAELARVAQQTRETMTLVGIGGVSMIAGTAISIAATNNENPANAAHIAKVGVGFTIVGAGFIAASLFTMPKNVSIDHRGFVFSLPFRQKKTATLKGDGQK